MLDGLSLDQLRIFIAASEEGSFSAAGRRLGRAQSAISQTLSNLEAQIGIQLFDRSGRKPILTEAGRGLLQAAHRVTDGVDLFKARAKHLAEGLEAELSIVVDVMFPIAELTSAVVAFHEQFPFTPLRVDVEALGAVIEPVMGGRRDFGIMGTLPTAPPELKRERLLIVPMVAVAAVMHPLANRTGPISTADLEAYIQIVLTDRSELSKGKEFNVLSPRVWRLADLGAKLAFIRAGLGWGGMPLHAVAAEIAAGSLVRLALEDVRPNLPMAMYAVYRSNAPPGPAARWLIERLKLSQSGKAGDLTRENRGALKVTAAIGRCDGLDPISGS